MVAPTGKIKLSCRGRPPGRPVKTNEYHKTINQPVILSEVELSPSEERGESAKRQSGLRDLA